LNAHLRGCCLAARERTCGDKTATVAARFEQDQAAALRLPQRPFDACVFQHGQVDKYQTAPFDSNRYSVPRRWAFHTVTVKGYVDHVAIVADGEVIARHERSYGRREKVLDPLHFLTVLERKPAALDHAPLYRDWHLPATFAELRRDLEVRLGQRRGAQHFIRVLQLLAQHPLERVEHGIRLCRSRGRADAATITAAVARCAQEKVVTLELLTCAPNVAVPLPDLSQFDRLLSHSSEGEVAHERGECPVVESQPEAVATADDVGGVGEAGP
jgi:hypothetical protein